MQFVVQSKTFYTPTMLVAYGRPCSENFFYETENCARRTEAALVHPALGLDGVSPRRPQWFAAASTAHAP